MAKHIHVHVGKAKDAYDPTSDIRNDIRVLEEKIANAKKYLETNEARQLVSCFNNISRIASGASKDAEQLLANLSKLK